MSRLDMLSQNGGTRRQTAGVLSRPAVSAAGCTTDAAQTLLERSGSAAQALLRTVAASGRQAGSRTSRVSMERSRRSTAAADQSDRCTYLARTRATRPGEAAGWRQSDVPGQSAVLRGDAWPHPCSSSAAIDARIYGTPTSARACGAKARDLPARVATVDEHVAARHIA
jgi:hypothetical protein